MNNSIDSDDDNIPELKGFELVEDFITVEEETELLHCITTGSSIPDRRSARIEAGRKRKYSDTDQRKCYSHRMGVFDPTEKLSYYGYVGQSNNGFIPTVSPYVVKGPPLPEYLDSLGEKVVNSLKFDFNGAVVIQYAPNKGVVPHFDMISYIDAIVGVSLGQEVEMKFLHYNYGENHAVRKTLPRRSAYILKNDALNDWKHGIEDGQCDGRRVSITFRKCDLKLLRE
jgi:alkylated DNA repair dioxygenase AlkB